MKQHVIKVLHVPSRLEELLGIDRERSELITVEAETEEDAMRLALLPISNSDSDPTLPYMVATTEEELLQEKALAVREMVGDLEMLGVPAEVLMPLYEWMKANLPAEEVSK